MTTDEKKRIKVKLAGTIRILYIWEFIFFNSHISEEKLNQITNKLHQLFHGRIINEKFIRKVFNKTKKKKHQIKEIYNGVHRDFNNTSLTLFHSPIFHINTQLKVFCNLCSCYGHKVQKLIHHSNHLQDGLIGQFLTGDINLNTTIEELRIHYRHRLSRVFALQVPHHGSIENWNVHIIDNNSYPHKYFVIPCSIKNNNKLHPNIEVLNSISNYGQSYLVNENLTYFICVHCKVM